MNTGISIEYLFDLSGIKERLPDFKRYLEQYKLTAQEYNFSNAVLTVVHEMGHYYIMKIRGSLALLVQQQNITSTVLTLLSHSSG